MIHPTASDLGGVSLFATMADDLRAAVAERFDIEEHAPGHRVVTEGSSGYAFYVVASGTLTVTKDGATIRALGPGDFFGEIAIIGDGRRTATVTAEGPVTLWALFGTAFRELQMANPEAAAAVQDAMDERVRRDAEG